MEIPVLDTRSELEIFDQIMELAASYVPEWNTKNGGDDPGILLSRIFAGLFADTLKRYNKIPYKNLIYFLNLLGADALPSIPAKGYATVKMNAGLPQGVSVKRGTKLYGQGQDGERVLFEVKEDFLAVDNRIERIYCKSDSGNRLIRSCDADSPVSENSIRLFDFYGSENLQSHKLYFCETTLLLVGMGTLVTLIFENTENLSHAEAAARLLGDAHCAKWYYYCEMGQRPLKCMKCTGNRLTFLVEGEIPEVELFRQRGYWLVCEILQNVEDPNIGFTHAGFTLSAEQVEADCFYCNDLPLEKENFLPYTEVFSPYDDFYIDSIEGFGKAGATVTVRMDLDCVTILPQDLQRYRMPDKWKTLINANEVENPNVTDVYPERVIWEYWNGNGWARLFQDNRYEDLFKVTEPGERVVQFKCPMDMSMAFVGADFGFWLRARILRVNQVFDINSRYHSPRIRSLKISYRYEDQMLPVKQIWAEKDLEQKVYHPGEGREIKLMNTQKNAHPAAYIKLKNPLRGGPIKLYFRKEGMGVSAMPSLKWEYYGNQNGASRWLELKVGDETEFFRKSGIVSFIAREDFQKNTLFGDEGYWIRLLNMDRQYDFYGEKQRELLPCFKYISFNTVKIGQQETMETEYFYIEMEQANRQCRLNAANILEPQVWVNEIDSLVGEDVYGKNMAADENISLAMDEQGRILEYWIRWERTDNLMMAGPQGRLYFLDPREGVLWFGDGVHGRIPPSGDMETIKIDYKVCAGENGNLAPYAIENFADAVPFVDWVTNLEPVSGGCHRETVEEAIAQSMKLPIHQNCAVSREDYEHLVKAADRNIVNLKIATPGEREGRAGSVKIALLPKLYNAMDNYFLGIKNNVLQQLTKKAPVILTVGNRLEIFEVQYIEYAIQLKASIADYNDYQEVYQEIEERLTQYLNPITGNFDGNGFQIGALPNRIKIYNYLKNVKRLSEIKNINILCYERVREYRKEIDYDSIFGRPFAVPISGTHEIELSVL